MQSYQAPRSYAQNTPNELELKPPPKCKLVEFQLDRADTWVIKFISDNELGIVNYNTIKHYCQSKFSYGVNSLAIITTHHDEVYVVISNKEKMKYPNIRIRLKENCYN